MPPHETAASGVVFICDLDHTLLGINSFPAWALHLAFGRMPWLGMPARARLALRSQGLLMRRRLGRIDHAGLLRGLQAEWHAAGGNGAAAGRDRFEARLTRQVRPALWPLLGGIAAGETKAVLATAAAGEYAVGLGRRLGFRHVVATPRGCEAGGRPAVGEEKCRHVGRLLGEIGWDILPRVVLTDHVDDLPLMRHGHAVAWYGRPDAVPAGCAQPVIACRDLGPDATAAALESLAARARQFQAASARRASTAA